LAKLVDTPPLALTPRVKWIGAATANDVVGRKSDNRTSEQRSAAGRNAGWSFQKQRKPSVADAPWSRAP
jgi:hypothetical protein